MCMFGGPKAPPAVAIPDPAPPPEQPAPAPQASDPAVQSRADSNRRQRLAANQQNSTLVTGGQGLTQPAATANKQLFGQ